MERYGEQPEPVVGRDELLIRGREQLARGGSVLLPGPAGIGKSTVLRALAAGFSGGGRLVLGCAPTASESQLPFLSLIDLLGPVADTVSGALPASQRTVLDAALTGRQSPSEQHGGLALRLAVLSVFRALAERGPVLVVADDLQWMDVPSRELLAFAARRTGGLPVQMIAAVRTGPEVAAPGGPEGRDAEEGAAPWATPSPPRGPAVSPAHAEVITPDPGPDAGPAPTNTPGCRSCVGTGIRPGSHPGSDPEPGATPAAANGPGSHPGPGLEAGPAPANDSGSHQDTGMGIGPGFVPGVGFASTSTPGPHRPVDPAHGADPHPDSGAEASPVPGNGAGGATGQHTHDRLGGGQDHETYLRVLPPPALVLSVTALTYPQTAALLSARRRVGLPGSVVRDIHRTSAGNPFYALELGRALVESGTPPRPGEPLPVPTGLRALVLDRLRAPAPGTRETLLLASAAARPTLALLRAAGRTDAEAEWGEATALGIVDGEAEPVVRFTHPLISAALYAAAAPRERRAAHTALAAASTDPIERARHLALATPGRDERVARTLAAAAAVARERGAPAAAARLGLLAADRTPAEAAPAAHARRLDAAEDALTAGEPELARATAHEVLAESVHPADRIRAWIAVIDSAGQAMADVDDVFPRALADAGGDPRLLAPLRYQLSWRAVLVRGSLPRARGEAAEAARLARLAGDRRTELLALSFQALTETLMGHRDAEHTLAKALEEPQDPRVTCDHNGPGYTRFRCLLMGDRLDEARTAVGALVRLAERRGAVESQILFLRGLAETELRAGRCEPALDLAHRSLRLARDAGIGEGPALQLTALTEAAGGSVARALSFAQDAVRSAEEDGDLLYLARNLYALGHARLVAGDTEGAVTALRRVRELERGQGVTDPARGRWQGDLAEALVRTGEPEEAAEVVEATRRSATRLRRDSVLAVLARAEALMTAAQGDPERAAHTLRTAGRGLRDLGYRIEQGRCELALAHVELCRGEMAAARTALDTAVRVFRHAHAHPWLERASAERAAVGAESALGAAARALSPPRLLDTLAEMERRVAALVLEGATNREIAARLFISVKTVEATLTRVYRKLGIRSRVDIVRLATRDGD
ncbi:AAA family ATPase [Streptomyces sp. NPDC048636]|uniref:AAA family ATPase n=1 Tax=Streptomyces sp. NPDC048636 TaxID=3155762 RepID=UPI0034258507